MSAEANEVVDNGPTIITVIGQEGHVPAVAETVIESKGAETEVKVVEEVKKEATGLEEQVETENRDEKGRYKPDAKTRIAEITRARREAERDAEYWKARALGTTATPPAQEAAAEVKQPPTRDAFESEEEFLDALTDHKVDIKLAARDQQARQVQEQTSIATTWQDKLGAARAEIPDFDAVLADAELPVERHVAGLIMEHDQGAKVMHHFATHPEELAKINEMTPSRAAFAIADIASQFKGSETASSSKPAVVAKKVSEAPPPAARNVGSGRSTTVPLGDMSMEDYVAARKAQGASWAR